jgi:hypothetical protein
MASAIAEQSPPGSRPHNVESRAIAPMRSSNLISSSGAQSGGGRIVQHMEHDDALAGIRLNRNRIRPWRHVRGRAAKASQ